MKRQTTSPRRREIVECALRIARDEGLPSLTVKRIAECVGFTEAALYRHFKGKRDLLASMIDWLRDEFIDPAREIAEDQTASPETRLIAILRRHFSLVREQRGLPIMLLAEAARAQDPQLLAETRSIFLTYRDLVAGLLRAAGAADGQTAEHLALAFIGAPAALAIGLRLTGEPEFGAGAENALEPWLEEAFFSARSGAGLPRPTRRTK